MRLLWRRWGCQPRTEGGLRICRRVADLSQTPLTEFEKKYLKTVAHGWLMGYRQGYYNGSRKVVQVVLKSRLGRMVGT
jgi:hypothetical protein